MNYIIGIALLLHVVLAWKAQVRVNKTKTLSRFQKTFNTVLNWLVPFLWSFLIRNMVRPLELGVMTKANRKTRSSGNSDNWQSLTGLGGGNDVSI